MRTETGELISPIKGKPTELDSDVSSSLISEGYAEAYNPGGGTENPVFIPDQSFTGQTEEYLPPGTYDAVLTVVDGIKDFGYQTLIITFDGVEYECPYDCDNASYGASFEGNADDFSEIPFVLFIDTMGEPGNFTLIANIIVGDNLSHTIKATEKYMIPFGAVTINAGEDVNVADKAIVYADGGASGTINITQNGDFDVAQYAVAHVAVTAAPVFDWSFTVVNERDVDVNLWFDTASGGVEVTRQATTVYRNTTATYRAPSGSNSAWSYPIVAIRGLSGKLNGTPTVSSGGFVMETNQAHFVGVPNYGTITIPGSTD